MPLTLFDVTDTALIEMLSAIELNDYIAYVCHEAGFDIDLQRLTESQARATFSKFI